MAGCVVSCRGDLDVDGAEWGVTAKKKRIQPISSSNVTTAGKSAVVVPNSELVYLCCNQTVIGLAHIQQPGRRSSIFVSSTGQRNAMLGHTAGNHGITLQRPSQRRYLVLIDATIPSRVAARQTSGCNSFSNQRNHNQVSDSYIVVSQRSIGGHLSLPPGRNTTL